MEDIIRPYLKEVKKIDGATLVRNLATKLANVIQSRTIVLVEHESADCKDCRLESVSTQKLSERASTCKPQRNARLK